MSQVLALHEISHSLHKYEKFLLQQKQKLEKEKLKKKPNPETIHAIESRIRQDKTNIRICQNMIVSLKKTLREMKIR